MKESVSTRNLVDLGERALDKARRRPDEGDDPHPEDSPRTARDDRDGNARNVADADARGRAHAERLKRGDRLASARTPSEIAREQAHHLGQRAQLDEPRRQREPESGADEHDDDDISPQEVVDRANKRIEEVHKTTLSKNNTLHHNRKAFCLSNWIRVFLRGEYKKPPIAERLPIIVIRQASKSPASTRVSPVIPSACGLDGISHLRLLFRLLTLYH